MTIVHLYYHLPSYYIYNTMLFLVETRKSVIENIVVEDSCKGFLNSLFILLYFMLLTIFLPSFPQFLFVPLNITKNLCIYGWGEFEVK